MEDPFEEAARLLSGARSVFFLTGAGMSAESGIRTFRGPEGLYQGVRPEQVATPEAFAKDPAFVWGWYKERLLSGWDAKPHAGHRALAAWQKRVGRLTVATQNVDDLHERAGTKSVIHLHGRIHFTRCTSCGERAALTKSLLRRVPPSCGGCKGLLRPDVVWFGEALPMTAFEEASAAAAEAGACVVVGTSGLVQPAATLPLVAQHQGAPVILIDPEATALDAAANVIIRDTAANALPRLVEALAAPKFAKP